jgi:hypothetical protein
MMKKTLYLLLILFFPFKLFCQNPYWARLYIKGSVSELGISPSEEIWAATAVGNVYCTKQIGELWKIGPFGSLDPYHFQTGETFERINFFSEDTLMISGFIQEGAGRISCIGQGTTDEPGTKLDLAKAVGSMPRTSILLEKLG